MTFRFGFNVDILSVLEQLQRHLFWQHAIMLPWYHFFLKIYFFYQQKKVISCVIICLRLLYLHDVQACKYQLNYCSPITVFSCHMIILACCGCRDIGCLRCKTLGMWDVSDVQCSAYGMLEIWDVWVKCLRLGCLEYGKFRMPHFCDVWCLGRGMSRMCDVWYAGWGMRDVWDMERLGYEMLEMNDIWHVGCSGCGMLGIWNVCSVGYLGCVVFGM